MTERHVQAATDENYVLAEGPAWDPARHCLHWVDIRRGLVLTGHLDSDGAIKVVDRLHLHGTVGAMAPSLRGSWIVANGDDLLEIDRGEIVRRMPVLGSDGLRRFNDGKPDGAGRYLIGTLSLSEPSSSEQLLIVEGDGSHRVLDADLTLSNVLAWSADGTRLYSIDTLTRRVHTGSYDPVTGNTGTRGVLLELEDGYPDGMCVDAEDHLWIAMWGLGQVRRYSPDGTMIHVIDVPAPHTTSVAFAGELLDTLVITTTSDGLSPAQLAEFPMSGRLFTARPGVTGVPQPLWDGFSLDHGTDIT